ncbi:hypothetical protein IJG78_02815 [Candidatus Saccharibacteria bacterium]|nr:hypothetical protein [Candidatus Saccharibacteria bacterium]MBQ3309584.1 hypothetical protein [Candidatus Saccharibacteria bacterium]
MSIKVISYDLGGPETSTSYRKLSDAIRQIGDYIKPLESFFLLATSLPCDTVRDKLTAQLDSNDKLIVIEADKCFASWQGVDSNTYNWIMGHRQ